MKLIKLTESGRELHLAADKVEAVSAQPSGLGARIFMGGGECYAVQESVSDVVGMICGTCDTFDKASESTEKGRPQTYLVAPNGRHIPTFGEGCNCQFGETGVPYRNPSGHGAACPCYDAYKRWNDPLGGRES